MDLAASLNPAVQVMVDARVSIRECRQREMGRKRIWHIHCEDAEIGYHGSQEVAHTMLAFCQRTFSFILCLHLPQ